MSAASLVLAAPASLDILAKNGWSSSYGSKLWLSVQQTLQMVLLTLLIGGAIGLVLGLALYSTRRGGLFANRGVFTVLNLVVNFIRPIPFIIFISAIRPLTMSVMHSSIGTKAAIFPMVIACSMATSRIVEQSLVATDPGIVEAGRAMGASRLHILIRILIPESLAPLILGYTYLFIGVLDMSAMAGAIGGGGLGNFAIVDGYNRYNDWVTWAAVAVLIIIVQVVQQIGNVLARKVLKR